MTVSELIEKLKEFDGNLEVAINNEPTEDTGFLEHIEVVTEETAPYDKSDGLYHRGCTTEGQEILVLTSRGYR